MKMRDVSGNLWFYYMGLGVHVQSAATVYSILSLSLFLVQQISIYELHSLQFGCLGTNQMSFIFLINKTFS